MAKSCGFLAVVAVLHFGSVSCSSSALGWPWELLDLHVTSDGQHRWDEGPKEAALAAQSHCISGIEAEQGFATTPGGACW